MYFQHKIDYYMYRTSMQMYIILQLCICIIIVVRICFYNMCVATYVPTGSCPLRCFIECQPTQVMMNYLIIDVVPCN